MPIIPFLGDAEQSLELVVRDAKESGADFILFGAGMTMRDNQAMWYLKKLSKHFPEVIEKYEKLYQAKYDPDTGYVGRYSPSGSYAIRISKLMLALCEKYGIKSRTKRYIPNDFRHWNYKIAEEFLNESYIAQMNGKAWANIFWAGQNIQNFGESIVDVAERGDLQSIRNVGPVLEERILKKLKEAD